MRPTCDDQFRETAEERNERLRAKRHVRTLEALWSIIADLSAHLSDDGNDYSPEGLEKMRRRVANALPPTNCPDWLSQYRDPPIVQSTNR